MILEIDEACVLEAVENCIGCLLLGCRVAREEGREINELLLLGYMLDVGSQVGAYWDDQIVLRDGRVYLDICHYELHGDASRCEVSLTRLEESLHLQLLYQFPQDCPI